MEAAGMLRPELQALPQIRERMTFIYVVELFPAHAGVIPFGNTLSCLTATFPRTRGGDPSDGRNPR